MGTGYAEIILKNATDVGAVQRGYMAEKDVLTCTVRALVDTGAGILVINEAVRLQLGLEIKGLCGAYLADGLRQVCRVTEPLEPFGPPEGLKPMTRRGCGIKALLPRGDPNILEGLRDERCGTREVPFAL